ncbi:unnamed protein product [Parascedosporium putredinis]|uniref:DSC E3 ubiquitin ligase complex subunit 3 C-terminal domain-containing protein n=1 Tax=Parascedosporium putredinis TaxID=1442378 RepID=A0A9P1H769_9PEZI|nr:unnamed protein product [Parascedosporium putredinis]CAI7999371.1 unnamed protein product [Parascedosporium putredinis]
MDPPPPPHHPLLRLPPRPPPRHPLPLHNPLAALKLLIRAALPALTRRRLRFIHQGRILSPDDASLAAVLDPAAREKPRSPNASFSTAPLATDNQAETGLRPTPRRRLLRRRSKPAQAPVPLHPRGPAHPDTMPGPDVLQDLEDAWIDDNGAGGAGGAADDAAGDEAGAGAGGTAIGDLLDVFIQGIVVGFFLPLASMTWLLREEGMWSKRRQVAVLFGVMVSVIIGLFKAITGDVD